MIFIGQLDSDWNMEIDNEFTLNLYSSIQKYQLGGLPFLRQPSRLCDDCRVLEIWEAAFTAQFEVHSLKRRAEICDLCNLFLKTCIKRNGESFRTATFTKVGSILTMNDSPIPVLFLCQSPEAGTPSAIQIGLPAVFASGSQAQFEVVRQWLKICDENHKHGSLQHPVSGGQIENATWPTRILDVGIKGEGFIRLRETSPQHKGEYVALSHRWGKPTHFCTFRSNLSEHKRGIPLERLPATFRDAVLTTRALGFRYLWIDSVCIIQGPDGDFSVEAKRMEQVFSAATCVLAASDALGQQDGFLKARKERDYVTFQGSSDQQTYYICEAIDDFHAHVLKSPLSSRGWVLQEHALARRTIFFTEHQMYWECGEGVRCETGTKMTNSLAAFLGDTSFPTIIMNASKGERIVRYQFLYHTYSRLQLSRPSDRPFAINGLQSRLLKAFGTEGDFGVFDEGPLGGHLRRSLLWHRGDDVPPVPGLVRLTSLIYDGVPTQIPSWSWMAYSGGIDYLKPEFDGVDWMELRSPWTRHSWGTTPMVMQKQSGGLMTLGGEVKEFDVEKAEGRDFRIIYDSSVGVVKSKVKCIVLGVKRSREPSEARENYVLFVMPIDTIEKTWRRVGAGYLPGSCIFGLGSPVVVI